MTDSIKPIKRRKELVSLSREHHDGLLLCWKINDGLEKNISTQRIGAYALYFFDNHLARHFNEEEQYIFPLLDANNIDRKEAELHHKLLREIADNFKNTDQIVWLSLQHFAEILEKHIRFEERVLFPLIEKEATPEALQSAATKLAMQPKCNIEWEDQFWIDKK